MLPERYPIFWDAVRRVGAKFPRFARYKLLVILFLIWLSLLPLSMSSGIEHTSDYWETTMGIQELLFLLVAPILAVGAFTAERERRSLDFLFLTPQSTGTIVLQKYLFASLPLLIILASFLPFVLHSLIWWPVPWGAIAINYLRIIAEGTFAAALALLASCLSRHTRVALFTTYAALVLLEFLVWSSLNAPLFNEGNEIPPPPAPLSPLLLNGIILPACTAIILWVCQRKLDRERMAFNERLSERTSSLAVQYSPSSYWYLPDKHPVFWDDMRRRLRGRQTFWLLLGSTLAICAVPVWLYLWQTPGTSPERWPSLGRDMFWYSIVWQWIMVCLVSPGLTALTFSSEREAHRMDFLQISGLSLRELVYGKFFGAIAMQGLLLLCGMPVLAIIAATFGGISPGELLLSYVWIIACGLFFAATALNHACQQTNATAALVRGYGLAFVSLLGFVIIDWLCCIILSVFAEMLGIRSELGFIIALHAVTLSIAAYVIISSLQMAITGLEKRLGLEQLQVEELYPWSPPQPPEVEMPQLRLEPDERSSESSIQQDNLAR